MKDITFIHNKEPRVRTFDIFSGFGYTEHRLLKRVIKDNIKLFKNKGLLIEAFAGASQTGRGRADKSYLLNERQLVLLLLLVKNSPETIVFKDNLENEFFRRGEALKELTKPSAHIEEIRKILLLDAPSQWVKLFPPEFYTALMKLYGKEFTSNNHTPPYCGQITRKWIYNRVLPKELQAEIDVKINKEKRHQWFTEKNGRATLLNQINQVTGIARISRDRKHFENNCEIAFNNAPLQLNIFL